MTKYKLRGTESDRTSDIHTWITRDDQARVALLTLEWYEAARAAGGDMDRVLNMTDEELSA